MSAGKNKKLYSTSSKNEEEILLLHPPITLKEEDVPTFGFYPPLGLGYVASVLLKEGYPVGIVDCLVEGKDTIEDEENGMVRVGLSKKEIESILARKKPKIVGIAGTFSSFSDDGIRLARIVRESLPKSFIIIGGAGTTEVKQLLATDVIDVLISGEAEYIFRDVVDSLSKGDMETAYKIKGTSWKVAEKIVTNPSREVTKDLDSIPFPAYHLLPMEKYLWQKHANFAAAMRWPIAHMITSRGCIYNCIFCSTTKYFAKFRARSVENVLAEMKLLMTMYGIREFHFHDDFFMSDVKRVRHLCEKIIEEKMDIRWQVSQGINSVQLDEELLELMYNSGMYRVGFPIDSGCPEMLKYMRKPINLDKVNRLIKKCNELGLYVFGNFVIGFPEETKEQIEQTTQFIMASGLDYAKISILQPHPGTDIYGVFERLGLLPEGLKHGSTYFHTEYNTVHLRAEELNAIRVEALKRCGRHRLRRMLSPSGIKKYIFPKFRSMESAVYFMRMGFEVLKGNV